MATPDAYDEMSKMLVAEISFMFVFVEDVVVLVIYCFVDFDFMRVVSCQAN